ncbi:MFS transporter [Nocardioides panacisoli]|uniref:MFS transporter n=1 Tax=Nocardioides panacisoli TaxID=627624 RepID=UPI001C626D4C|nr:MFS transporter [Nocardioides panacisoli]QYJ04032.1 MFS transporter [Nocardioides panacisoli]
MAHTLATTPLGAAPLGPRRRWAALAVLMLPVLLVSVDNTVLAFAVPTLTTALQPSGDELLWLIDSYPLVLAGLLVTMGTLGDRVGCRRLLLVGATGFAIVSVAAAFAPDARSLIAARALLGVFGAMLMPATLALLRSIFTDPDQRRTAVAIWASGFSAGAVLGPIVGGWLLQHFWWGSIFLLAVPVLVPLLVLGPLLLPEARDPSPGPLDPTSVLLAIGTMLPLVFAIKTAAGHGSVALAAVATAVGLANGVTFVRRQQRRPAPMLDVGLFRNPVFSGALTLNLLSVLAMVGFVYFLSQHLQLVAGMSPVRAAAQMVPGLLMTILAGLAAVALARRLGTRTVVTLGLALSGACYALVAVGGHTGSVPLLVTAFVLLGAGVGMSETLSGDLALGAVPPHKAGGAAALSETAYEVGAVLGTAVMGSLLNAAYTRGLDLPAGLTAAEAEQAGETLGGAHGVAAEAAADRPEVAADLLDAAAHAFDAGVTLTAALAVVLIAVATRVIRRALRDA